MNKSAGDVRKFLQTDPTLAAMRAFLDDNKLTLPAFRLLQDGMFALAEAERAATNAAKGA